MTFSHGDLNNIPLDFYTDNRIIRWEVDATRIEDWFAALDAETRRLVSAAVGDSCIQGSVSSTSACGGGKGVSLQEHERVTARFVRRIGDSHLVRLRSGATCHHAFRGRQTKMVEPMVSSRDSQGR